MARTITCCERGLPPVIRNVVELATVALVGRYIAPHLFGVVYAGLGEKDLAFKWLNEAVVKRDPDIVMLNATLELDSLRSDPRFDELKRRVGLPQ